MFSFLVVVFLALHSLVHGAVLHQTSISDWTKLNANEVCFKGRQNGYGSFHNFVRAGMVVAMKLEYLSGEIRCVAAVEYNSRWGCGDYTWSKPYPLNVVITDNHDKILFPKDKRFLRRYGNWYWLPYADSENTKDLVFSDFAKPFYLPIHAVTRIWYGEDLANWAEGNNQGRVCVNVYAKFLN